VNWPEISYPATERSRQVDVLHGEKVADPYRWLEDLDDPRAAAWVSAQNELTDKVLAAVESRGRVRDRLTQLWALPATGVPLQRGSSWFQARSAGLGEQPNVLHVMTAPDEDGRVLLDPGEMSADGTVAVASVSVSPDGSLLAYATSRAGSDWLTWRVRDVASGVDLPDILEWSDDGTTEWRPDGAGFFYKRSPVPLAGREYTGAKPPPRIFFHQINCSQDDDELVFAPAGDSRWPDITVSTDGEFLIVSLSRGLGSGNELRVLELTSPGRGWQLLVPEGQARYDPVATVSGVFYLVTDDAADRRRVVAVDLASPARQHWRTVVHEASDTLMEAHFFGGRLVCHYLRDACSLLRLFRLDGTAEPDIPMPAMSTLSGRLDRHDAIEGAAASDVVYFQAESFTETPSLWRHDLGSGETSLAGSPSLSLGPDYITERVLVASADGTRLPLFLSRRRDLPRAGNAPVLLHGYGGVGVATTPHFSAAWAVWLERGGMLAVASLRGGGEYGRSWYEAGRLGRKQQVFDDFCACARWLASSGWSRADRIGVIGGSNGGLLVGACLTQHPELFGAAVAHVGVLDMLRFHLFTCGWLWKTEYGDPGDPNEFQWLRRYSPLHNVRPECYPATLLTTGDHDDRVVPGHSLKFAAALQAAQAGSAPILLRVGASVGHGQGKPTGRAIAEAADCLAFLDGALMHGEAVLADRSSNVHGRNYLRHA
jgi:prolyl oligopeptidase